MEMDKETYEMSMPAEEVREKTILLEKWETALENHKGSMTAAETRRLGATNHYQLLYAAIASKSPDGQANRDNPTSAASVRVNAQRAIRYLVMSGATEVPPPPPAESDASDETSDDGEPTVDLRALAVKAGIMDEVVSH
jgi:hypothetical protein